jgi:hypothetical protein
MAPKTCPGLRGRWMLASTAIRWIEALNIARLRLREKSPLH